MPLIDIEKNIVQFDDLKEYNIDLVKFEQQREGKVKKYLEILTDCKYNKQVLDLYYDDIYYNISLIQISVIILSSIVAFLQALREDVVISKEFVSIFTLCVSTYISLILSILKFLKLDEKKELINELSNKYSDIQNKIRYTLDLLKPWKEPWYLEIEQIKDKLIEWTQFKLDLSTNYLTIAENKQNLKTEYEKILRNKVDKYISKIDANTKKDIDSTIINTYKDIDESKPILKLEPSKTTELSDQNVNII